MRIGILTIATGRYDRFINQLQDSIVEYFLKDCKNNYITTFVHTDKTLPFYHVLSRNSNQYELKAIPQAHLGWPFSTLYRYRIFLRNYTYFSQFDYLYYLDIDMKIVSSINEEILTDLLAVKHPGFACEPHDTFPHEKRKESLAFVPAEQRIAYYCGGVQGGKSANYLQACLTMKSAIESDLDNGIVAMWHDESHWNKYLIGNKPTRILDSNYCVPEEYLKTNVNAKIIALKKNHEEIRS